MNIEQLRTYALSKPDVEETLPFGPDTLVFKVKGKMFLLCGMDEQPLQFNVKCDPDTAIELREQYPDTVLPGYHMNKKYWNTIVCNPELKLEQIADFIRTSYQLIRTKKKNKK